MVLEPNMGIESLFWHQEYYKDTSFAFPSLPGGMVNSAWKYHPAYVYGNKRVSCACCVLACENDLRIGIAHNPHIRNKIALLEQKSGFTFLPKKSIMEV